MSAVRFTSLLLSALCLSACAGGPSSDFLGRYPTGGSAPDAALASLPAAAGRVLAVRRKAFTNGLSEQLVLDGPRGMAGENTVTVEAVTGAGTGGRGAQGDEIVVGPPSDVALAAEMERLFPGMPMRISATAESNPQGPFGYAVGTAGPLACVYAWQYLTPAHPLTLFEGVSNTGAHPVSIRVRLCREQPAAALVDDLRLLSVARPGDGLSAAGPDRTALAADALDAAVGVRSAAAAGGTAARDPDMAEPRALARYRARPRHLPRRIARHVTVQARRGEALRAPDVGTGATPHVPLPGEVAATTAPRGPERPASMNTVLLRPAPVDDLPLPR